PLTCAATLRTPGCAGGVPREHRDPARLAWPLEAALAGSLRLAKTEVVMFFPAPDSQARFASRRPRSESVRLAPPREDRAVSRSGRARPRLLRIAGRS